MPDSVAENADGVAAVIERARVRMRVDAPRHAADHDRARGDGRIDHGTTGMHAVVGVVPAADDGHRPPRREREVAKGEEQARRVGNLGEPGGIAGIAGEDDA